MMVSDSLTGPSSRFLPWTESDVEFLSDVASSLGDKGGVDASFEEVNHGLQTKKNWDRSWKGPINLDKC